MGRTAIGGLALSLICSSTLVGADLERAAVCLTPRETIKLIRPYPNYYPDYPRFWLANPDVKPALYDRLRGATDVNEQSMAVSLISVTGDEQDVPRLVAMLQRDEIKNGVEVRRFILRALALLGDRGAREAYAALERLLDPAAWPQTRGAETDEALQQVIGALSYSKHPEFPRLFLTLRKAHAGKPLAGQLEAESEYLLSLHREQHGQLSVFGIYEEKRGRVAEWAKLLAADPAGGRQATLAASALETMSSLAAAALPAIEPHLSSTTNPRLLAQLLIVLSEVGPPAKTVAAKVRVLQEHQDPVVRAFAALALARIAQASPDTKQCLARALDDRSSLVRLHVLTAFGVLGAELEPPVATALTEIMLRDKHTAISHGYAFIGRRGEPSYFPKSLPDVIRAAATNEAPLRCAAAFALGRTHTKVPSPALIPALGTSDRALTLYVLEMADATWAGRTELLAPVLRLLGRARDDETLAVLAVDASVAIGAPKPEVIAALVAQSAAGGAWPRVHALRALGQLGDRDTPALIRPLLDNDNEFVKDAAAQALKALDARSR